MTTPRWLSLGALFAAVVVTTAWGTAALGAATVRPAEPGICSAPAGVTCVANVAYAAGGKVHTLDVYFPTGAHGEASVMVIHGGSWAFGGSGGMAKESIYLAQNGFAAFSINYTLSTPDQPSYPQVVQDVDLATGWIAAHASDYGADGTRLAALGSSAGGNLAALQDTAGPEHGHPLVTTVAWSGAMDMPLTYQDGDAKAQHYLAQLFGCTPDTCLASYVAESPDSHVTSDDGSMLFFNSSDELVPVSGAYAMNRALNAAHVPHKLVVFHDNPTKHAKQYECDPATVLGVTAPVIDGSLRWLGDWLNGTPLTPTGTFCQ